MEDKANETKDIIPDTFIKLSETEGIPKFSQICRVCLCETNESDQQLDTRILLLNNSQEIKSLLQEATGVQIVDLDFLPNHICDKCFKTLIAWYRFRSQTQRSNEILEKYIKELSTSVGNKALSGTDFTIHMQGKNLNVVPIQNVSQIQDFQISVLTDKPAVVGFVFHCGSCSMTFSNQNGLDKHQEEHTNATKQQSFKCEHCPKSFAFRSGMHNHIKLANHHCKRFKYQCDVCERRYNSPTGFKLHRSKPCVPVSLIEECKIRQLDVRKEELTEIAEKTIRETKISCILCKKNFKSRDDFSDHYPKHSKDRKCNICNKDFTRVKILERHVRMHLRATVYSCPLCTRSFYTIQAFRVHVHEHGTRELVYRCNVCQKEFFLVRDFDKHMVKHLEDDKKALEKTKHNDMADVIESKHIIEIDSECESNISAEGDVSHEMETDVRHFQEPYQLVKVEEDSKKDDASYKPEKDGFIKTEMDFSVDTNTTFDSKQHIQLIKTENEINSQLETEIPTKHENSNQAWQSQNVNSNQLSANATEVNKETSPLRDIVKLENPASSEEENAVETDDDLCNVAKSNEKNSQNQSTEYTQELLDKCKVNCHIAGCQTTFSDLNQIWEHFKKQHLSGNKPYQCASCLEIFKHQKSLRFHIKDHYSFKCPVCCKIKITSSELKKHVILTHSQHRPYKCSHCDRKFNRIGALKAHENTHSDKKEFVCNICSKDFFSNNGLYLHLKSHKDIKELQCPICNRQLPSKGRLKRHIDINTCGRKRKKQELQQRY